MSLDSLVNQSAQPSEVLRSEQLSIQQRCGRFLGKVGLAAVCVIPTADLALSDVANARIYDSIQNEIDLGSDTKNLLAQDALIGLAITAQSVALGAAITKTKKLQGVFEDFGGYLEEKQTTMPAWRRPISKVINAPFSALGKLGDGFTNLGEKIASRKSKIVRGLGRVAIDVGQINALGTSTVILQETSAGNVPNLKRNAYLGFLIASSWVVGAEAVRGVYRNVPLIRPPMALIGRTVETLTTMNLTQPWETPIGTTAIGATSMALAITGWKIGQFHEQKEAELPTS